MGYKDYKEIVYLDEVELTSALAQLQGGLKESLVATDNQVKGTTTGGNLGGNIDGKVDALIAKAALGANWNLTAEKQNSESVSQAMNVVFKDYQLERLLKELDDELQKKTDSVTEGSFVLIEGSFKLLDFSSMLTIVTGNTLKNLMKKIPDSTDSNKTCWNKQAEDGFKLMGYLADLGNKMLPDTMMVLLPNASVYAEKSNFRIATGQTGPLLASERKIHVLGVVESYAGNSKMDMDTLNNEFAKGDFSNIGSFISSFSENLLTDLGVIKSGNQLIKPIAIYFEND
jgi:hypothetical protein